jgi:hypothetical protein
MKWIGACLLAALAIFGCNRAPEPAKPGAEASAQQLAADLHALDRDVMAVLEVKSTAKLAPAEEAALKRGSTLNPPATLDDVHALERRIGRRLPPSYREFLLASNGMVFEGALNVVEMLGTKGVVPLTAENYPAIDAWLRMADVAVPGDTTSGGPLPGPALERAWVISSIEDGDVYLILPALPRPDGEWPVWFFGPKNPGAFAYPSFGAMLERERAKGLQELKDR